MLINAFTNYPFISATPTYDGLNTLKFAFHHATKDEMNGDTSNYALNVANNTREGTETAIWPPAHQVKLATSVSNLL